MPLGIMLILLIVLFIARLVVNNKIYNEEYQANLTIWGVLPDSKSEHSYLERYFATGILVLLCTWTFWHVKSVEKNKTRIKIVHVLSVVFLITLIITIVGSTMGWIHEDPIIINIKNDS